MRLCFEIIPSGICCNGNQDQNFSTVIEDHQWIEPNRNCVIEKLEKDSGNKFQLKAVALNVKPNKVTKVEKLGNLEKCEVLDYCVPVMLHYEGGILRITAYADEGKSPLWQKSVNYQLPAQYFPRAKMSSKWKQTENQMANCQLKFDEIVKEEWSYLGPIHHYIRFTDDYSVVVDFGIQLALNSQTLEPMTYYFDRVHALKNMTIYLDQTLLGGIPPLGKSPITPPLEKLE